jgi:dTMP kinase
VSLRRRGHRPADRIEASGDDFLSRVADGFAREARLRRWDRLDATQSPEQVLAAAQRALTYFFDCPARRGPTATPQRFGAP